MCRLSFLSFLPRNREFYDLFSSLAEIAVASAELLLRMPDDLEKKRIIHRELKDYEVRADDIVHKIVHSLVYDTTRVTEEKSDIQYFIHNLDNIIDSIERVAHRLTLLDAKPAVFEEFTKLIYETVKQVKIGVDCLKERKQYETLLKVTTIRINTLEEEADKLHRQWMEDYLIRDINSINLLRDLWLQQEIVSILERIMDECEDVANILDIFRLKGGI